MSNNGAYICEFCKKQFFLRGYKCKKCSATYCLQCMSYLQGCICESKVKQAYINNKFAVTHYKARSKTIKPNTNGSSVAKIKNSMREISPKFVQTAESEDESISNSNPNIKSADNNKINKKISQLQFDINSLKCGYSSVKQLNSDMLSSINQLEKRIREIEGKICINKEESISITDYDKTKITDIDNQCISRVSIAKCQILKSCKDKIESFANQMQEFVTYQYNFLNNQLKEYKINIPKFELRNECQSCKSLNPTNKCRICSKIVCNKCIIFCSVCMKQLCKSCQVNCSHCVHVICENCSSQCKRCSLPKCKKSECKQIIFIEGHELPIQMSLLSLCLNCPLLYNHLQNINIEPVNKIMSYIFERRANFPIINVDLLKGLFKNEQKISDAINSLLLENSQVEEYNKIELFNQAMLQSKQYEQLSATPSVIQILATCEKCNQEYFKIKPKYFTSGSSKCDSIFDYSNFKQPKTPGLCECQGKLIITQKSVLYIGNTLISKEVVKQEKIHEIMEYTIFIPKIKYAYQLAGMILLNANKTNTQYIVYMGPKEFVYLGDKSIQFSESCTVPEECSAILVYTKK